MFISLTDRVLSISWLNDEGKPAQIGVET